MKKIIMALSLCVFSFAAFAGEEKTLSVNSEKSTMTIGCTPTSYKVFHTVSCPNNELSHYTVDWVDTVVRTCNADGTSTSVVYHWPQKEHLICS